MPGGPVCVDNSALVCGAHPGGQICVVAESCDHGDRIAFGELSGVSAPLEPTEECHFLPRTRTDHSRLRRRGIDGQAGMKSRRKRALWILVLSSALSTEGANRRYGVALFIVPAVQLLADALRGVCFLWIWQSGNEPAPCGDFCGFWQADS